MLRLITCLLASAMAIAALATEPDPDQIVGAAQVSFKKLMSDPEKAIPSTVFADAHGLLIWPETASVQFVAGGRFQHCVLVTRKSAGGAWNAPQFLKYRMGSVGAQAGSIRSTVVQVYLTRPKLELLHKRGIFLVGFGGRVAWKNGTDLVGHPANNSDPDSSVLTYSSGRGATGGVFLQTQLAKIDQSLGDEYYAGMESLPDAAREFLLMLQAYDASAQAEFTAERPAAIQANATDQ